jgi:hypothetical protein
MGAIKLDVETSLPPHVVKTALLDFTDRRPDIWPGLSKDEYKVISVGETTAEVREGNPAPKGVWAVEHYDWSQPDIIRWTVVASGFCTPGSYAQARLEESGGGGTIVHLEWDRTGVGLKGKLIVALVRLLGGKPFRSSFETGLRKLEARAGGDTDA